MKVREFLSILQEALDAAAARGGVRGKDVVATFVAPSSGFCGPSIRPKYLGETSHPDYPGSWARYGITRTQAERLLTAFDVTLPPEFMV